VQFFRHAQIEKFAREIREDLGNAWNYMTPETRGAFVDSKTLALVRGLDRESVPMELVDQLTNQLRAELGLEGV
jgi:hypothetical protein